MDESLTVRSITCIYAIDWVNFNFMPTLANEYVISDLPQVLTPAYALVLQSQVRCHCQTVAVS